MAGTTRAIIVGHIHTEMEFEEVKGKPTVRFAMRPHETLCEGDRVTQVTVTGKLAEVCNKHLRPNFLVCVEGKTNKDLDKIKAERVVFIKAPGYKKESAQNGTPGATTTINT